MPALGARVDDVLAILLTAFTAAAAVYFAVDSRAAARIIDRDLLQPVLPLAIVAIAGAAAIWLLRAYMLRIPRELEEAAWADGASRFYIFRRVILPLLRPAIVGRHRSRRWAPL